MYEGIYYCHTRPILKFSPTEFLQIPACKMGHEVVWLSYPPTQPNTLEIIEKFNISETAGWICPKF
jgi:hypothetical protein